MQGKSRSDNDNGKGCEHMQFTWNELLVFPILFFANLIQAITGGRERCFQCRPRCS